MKKFSTYLIFVFIFNLAAANWVLADSSTTLQAVQEDTQNLINIKDQENTTSTLDKKTEIAVRLEVFNKVLDFSLNETQDIISQLNNLNNLATSSKSDLRNQLLDKFQGFVEFYSEQKANLASTTTEIDLAGLKKLAQDFKDWRAQNYLPIFETATDFLLLNQQKTILGIAEKRYQKISSDIYKLKKANLTGTDRLENYLNQADISLKEAKGLWQKAEDEFSTSTSSIKGLISDSLNKIKETYQIFIEMSNFVKKLLK